MKKLIPFLMMLVVSTLAAVPSAWDAWMGEVSLNNIFNSYEVVFGSNKGFEVNERVIVNKISNGGSKYVFGTVVTSTAKTNKVAVKISPVEEILVYGVQVGKLINQRIILQKDLND